MYYVCSTGLEGFLPIHPGSSKLVYVVRLGTRHWFRKERWPRMGPDNAG